jgi:glutathione S-transferase
MYRPLDPGRCCHAHPVGGNGRFALQCLEGAPRAVAHCPPSLKDGFAMKLVIGNKNYSSWSMRPWLALRASHIPFEEAFIPLYTGDADKQRILDFSRAGKVPILVDGEITIWDSLAIIEYVAERFPERRLWPEDPAQRAHARSISAEMHSGFAALRNECGMNLHRPVRAIALSDEARANISRIQAIWTGCRARYGKSGPFLFGAFGAADAMFAPVVHRFRTYAIAVTPEVQTYMDTMMALPAFREWTEAALAETLVIDKFETI